MHSLACSLSFGLNDLSNTSPSSLRVILPSTNSVNPFQYSSPRCGGRSCASRCLMVIKSERFGGFASEGRREGREDAEPVAALEGIRCVAGVAGSAIVSCSGRERELTSRKIRLLGTKQNVITRQYSPECLSTRRSINPLNFISIESPNISQTNLPISLSQFPCLLQLLCSSSRTVVSVVVVEAY